MYLHVFAENLIKKSVHSWLAYRIHIYKIAKIVRAR